jgi:hypothetical protein
MSGQKRDLAVTGTPAPDLRVVLAFRKDSTARLENLNTVLRYLVRLLPGAEILIFEDSAEPSLQHVSKHPGARHVWRRNTGIFHRTRLLNHAMLDPNAPALVAAWDCDVLACPAGLALALSELRAGAGMALPYDGRFIDLRGDARQSLVTASDTAWLPGAPYPSYRPWLSFLRSGSVCENVSALGGAVLFRREVLSAAGGYHEGFRSWGYEDIELAHRMTALGHPPRRAQGWPLFHLSHPRDTLHRLGTPQSWYVARRQNRALNDAMSALSPAELAYLIASGGLRGPDEAPPLPNLSRGRHV